MSISHVCGWAGVRLGECSKISKKSEILSIRVSRENKSTLLMGQSGVSGDQQKTYSNLVFSGKGAQHTEINESLHIEQQQQLGRRITRG